MEDFMTKEENRKLIINRVVSFLAGGLLVFAVMSFTVVSSANKMNEELSRSLDTSQFEAGRLLADAKAQLESKNYEEAKTSLNKLFVNQPGSAEAVEGKTLLVTVEAAEKASDMKWEAAMPGIQKKWTGEMVAELRAESDKKRAELEKDMTDTTSQAWEKAKDKVRDEWEKQSKAKQSKAKQSKAKQSKADSDSHPKGPRFTAGLFF
jgi:hypothetical protein